MVESPAYLSPSRPADSRACCALKDLLKVGSVAGVPVARRVRSLQAAAAAIRRHARRGR
jgi:hypothetical protein